MQKVVVRYLDGRVVRGHTANFNPAAASFLLDPADTSASRDKVVVEVKQIKALFFVRNFQGNPKHRDKKTYRDGSGYQGRKVTVTFSDGEVFVGSTLSRDPHQLGFFVFPADPESNTIKAFVPNAAVKNVAVQ